MVKFIDIDPKDIDTARQGRRGRVSYPIIKAFMERNQKVSKLDLAGFDRNPAYLRQVLGAYISSHKMPIKIFSANGEIHMMRLDLNNDNEPIPFDFDGDIATEGAEGHLRDAPSTPINADTVKERARQEEGKTTK